MKWAGLVVAVCMSGIAQEGKLPPKSIMGVYRGVGRGSIRITPGDQGKINFALKLRYANGHTCEMDKPGEWKGERLVVLADGLDPNQSCKLEARFQPGRIQLTDEGQRCAQVYCGTRGKLDGVVLSKSRR